MTEGPSIARSPREAHPEVVVPARELAGKLAVRRRSRESGWLLLSLVAGELQRKPPIATEAAEIAAKAAAAFRMGDEAALALEIEAAIRGGRLGQFGELSGRVHLSAATIRSGLLGALDLLASEMDVGAILGWYALFGLHADGARLAERHLRHADAGRLWKAAQRPLEAARAYAALGDDNAAISALVCVPSGHRLYRPACVALARMALRAERLDFEIDHFVGGFLATAPEGAREVEALRHLAKLYALYGRKDESLALEQQAMGTTKPALATTPGLPGMADFPAFPDLPALPSVSGFVSTAATAFPSAVGDNSTLLPAVEIPRAGSLASPVSASGQQTIRPVAAMRAPPAPPPIAALSQFVPGATVGGRYRLEKTLGQGAMGAVFRATDFELGEKVAIKVMAAPANNERWLQRFRQELKLTRRLAHPNIVRVYDIGVHENARYITMELLEGSDLRSHQAGGLTHAAAVAIVEQAAAGLASAHGQGVVHRDVKPENLFVTDAGTVKVMDFGIARGRDDGGIDEAGLIAGTASYMAPEQADDFATAGPSADLYALGIVAYELFCGEVPFRHDDIHALFALHAMAEPESPRALDPTISPAIERELLRAIAKAPQLRHADCVAFAEALREALAEAEIFG